MRLELVSIPTPTLPLDGLYYEPDGGAIAAARAPCTVKIIPDCDHFYNGREDAVIEAVTSWRYING